MSVLLLVRAMDDLPRACREAGELLAIQYRRRRHDEGGAVVLGLWIEARSTKEVPVALSCRDRSGARRTFPVHESAGVPGVWTMLWFDVPGDACPNETRHFIAQALIESAGPDGANRASGRFVPVFAANAAAEALQAEMRHLRERFPGRLAPPLFQDPATGRLSSFPVGEADG
jgi:hypothetical protein